MRSLVFIFLFGWARPAFSHIAQVGGPTPEWTFEPWVVACLALSVALYLAGAARLWRRVTHGHRAMVRQFACFLGGWCTLGVALVSPLDALGNLLFSAHMLQHELLMIVAAPLLVLGRPFGFWVWAMPLAWRQTVGGATRVRIVSVPWRAITRPMTAWLLHAAAVWLWHVPALFEAALRSNNVHVLQHLSFLASALLFWWAVLGESINRPPRGASVVYLFTTMMHTSALGALLTVSDNLWYPAYAATSSALGFEPIEDQQLGGLIMWVPGGLAYVFAGLMLCARWLAPDRQPVRASGVKAWSERDRRRATGIHGAKRVCGPNACHSDPAPPGAFSSKKCRYR